MKIQITNINGKVFYYDLQRVETGYGTLYRIATKVPVNVRWNNKTYFELDNLIALLEGYYFFNKVVIDC